MRFAPTFVVSAVLLPFVSAVHSHSSSPRHLSRLQNHDSRDLLGDLLGGLDLCVDIPNLVVNLLNNLLGVDADVCLCLEGLNLYLDAEANVTLSNQVLANVDALIGAKGQCGPLPAHAHRVCDPQSPCKYECDTGFTLCNGKCVSYGIACGPSATALSPRSRAPEITTFAEAQAHCKTLTVCGVQDPKGPFDFECVDVKNNFDSCGGCVTPPPFLHKSRSTLVPTGRDCGRISNARSVSCEASKCVVQQCRRGLTLSAKRDQCVAGGQKRMHKDKSRRAPINIDTADGAPPDSSSSASTPVLNSTAASAVMDVMNAAQAVSTTSAPEGMGPMLQTALNDTMNMLNSSMSALPSNVDSAVNSTTATQTALTQYGCALDLLAKVTDLVNSLLKLQSLCEGGAPTMPASGQCLDLSKVGTVLCSLVEINPLLICGLGLESLQGVVNGLTNTLGLEGKAGLLGPCPAPASMNTTTSPPAADTPPANATPPPTGDPSTASVVLSINLVLNLIGQLDDTASNISSSGPSACGGGLLSSVEALLNELLSSLGLSGINLNKRVDLLGLGLIDISTGGDGNPAADASTGATALTSGLLGGLTNLLGGVLGPLVQNVLNALGLSGPSCGGADALDPLLTSLIAALNNLLGGMQECGCANHPAVVNALAAPPSKRAVKASSRRGHVNVL
ncbi:hypothetical protein B0H11DRAFT_1350482 [Mycena galericulata]|nr:hypothetical protein B0H11DRAFT_1350482 [Mycena galericulata]